MNLLEVVLVESVATLLTLALVTVVWLVARRWWVSRSHLTFELSVSPGVDDGVRTARGWTLGVGRYGGDRLEWFRVFSFSLRPERVFERGFLDVVVRREPQGPEAYALFSGHVVVECTTEQGPVQLAMSPQSLTGMLAWLEAAPPGHGASRAV